MIEHKSRMTNNGTTYGTSYHSNYKCEDNH